ncbi:MAG: hypothetical protein KJN63_02685 [Acidimicrobiia bacterium]|nr:hypothetical protein [Acidimicrobiia bacterium]
MSEETHDIAMWIDIPVSMADPVDAALLSQFLQANNFPFQQSARFFSVPGSEAERLEERVDLWAFHHEMPPDDRVEDSLDGTLRRLGEVVMLAIAAANANVSDRTLPASGIDLTARKPSSQPAD